VSVPVLGTLAEEPRLLLQQYIYDPLVEPSGSEGGPAWG
jgi:hypothetical protein